MNDIELKTYKKLYVNQSKVAGEGLFAGENIAKGEHILSFGGVFALQNDRYSGKYLSSTTIGITENINLCEKINSEKDISDYINHSCNPNTGMFDAITIIAIKDIAQDEEIVCDYSFWETNEDWVMKKECCCGYNHCRKIIDGKYWKSIIQTDNNFNFFSPFIKRRIIQYGRKD